MATATPNTRTETRTVEEEVTDGVVLTLTDAEAETLAEITWRTGGNPFHSRRGHVDNIGAALASAGVRGPGYTFADPDYETTLQDNSRLWFGNLPEDDPAREGLREATNPSITLHTSTPADPTEDFRRYFLGGYIR